MTTAASLPANSWRVHFPMPSGVRRLQLKYCGSCFSHKNAARLKESSALERDARIPHPPMHMHAHTPALSSPFIARYAPHLSGQLSLTHHWSGQLATLIGNRAFFSFSPKVAQSVNETSAPLWSNVCREAADQRPKGTAESDSRQPLLFHSSCFLCPKAGSLLCLVQDGETQTSHSKVDRAAQAYIFFPARFSYHGNRAEKRDIQNKQ